MSNRGPAIALVCVGLLGPPGCTLLEPYPDDAEQGEAACHNDRDDDGDGRTDCADPSCGECVAHPALACPEGWIADAMLSPFGLEVPVCAPPARAVDTLDGCLAEAPPGSRVVSTTPGALAEIMRTQTAPSPDPDGPPLELYLAPGVHSEHDVLLPGHIALHGLCGAILETEAGVRSLPFADGPHLELDHIELRMRAVQRDAPVTTITDLHLSHVRVVEIGGPTDLTLTVRGASSATIDHSTIAVRLVATDARLSLSDTTLLRTDITGSRATLDHVRVEGSLTVTGSTATFVARDLVVHCGGLVGSRGATLDLMRTVVTHGRVDTGFAVDGYGGQRGVLTAEHLSVLADDTCARGVSMELASFVLEGTDATVTRLLVHEPERPHALNVDLHSTLTLRDATLLGDVDVASSTIDAERVRVIGASGTGLRVRGSMLAAATGTLRRVYVEGVPEIPRERTPCAELSAGIAFEAPSSGRIEASVVRGVSGCGLFVPTDVALDALDVAVSTTWTALCAPGREDAAALASSLRIDDTTERLATTSGICVGRACDPPAGCTRLEACTNGMDDDGDGLADCEDADCPACVGDELGRCANATDDDHDGLTDCDDPDCLADLGTCGVHSEAGLCTNHLDDDHDGLTDCDDPDCGDSTECRETCTGGADEDHDGAIDCADPECTCTAACASFPPPSCPGRDLGSALGLDVAAGTLPSGTSCPMPTPSCTSSMGPVVSFAWTAPATGTYTFTTEPGTAFDSVLEVFDRDCTGHGLGCNDDAPGSTRSQVTVSLVAGQVVAIRLQAWGRAEWGPYVLGITGPS